MKSATDQKEGGLGVEGRKDGWRKRAHIANRIDDRRATGVAHSDFTKRHTQKEKRVWR
jgi:hypothetical protein